MGNNLQEKRNVFTSLFEIIQPKKDMGKKIIELLGGNKC